MTPFEQWFSSDWQKAIREVPQNEPGILSSGFSIHMASWDRRAAYLLWVERGRPLATWVEKTKDLYRPKPSAAAVEDLDDLLGATAAPDDDLEDLLG